MVKQRVCVHSEVQLYFQNYRGKETHSKRALFSLNIQIMQAKKYSIKFIAGFLSMIDH